MSTADAPEPAPPRLDARLLLVRAPYYRDVIEGMTEGAARLLAGAGARHEILDVAGAFELPAAIGFAARAGTHDAYVALGCIVRGGTDHYDHICRETMAGLMRVALECRIALGAGVLTVHSIEQARARSAPDRHNKGAEAAAAALHQLAALRRFAS